MIPQVERNLKEVMKDKRKRAELEEQIKIELLHGTMINPADVDIEIKFNKTANCYDIHIRSTDPI